jgi:hypothetical protein
MTAPEQIPLLELCWRLLEPASGGGYLMSKKGEAALVQGLLDAKADPNLAVGVHALFEAAFVMHEDEASPDAAAAILRALNQARPQLPLREQAVAAIQAASEGGLNHVEKRAPALGASAPEGSIKAFRFSKPGKTRA